MFLVFQQIKGFFEKKVCKVYSLRRFCSAFPSKSPIFGRISEVGLDRKCIEIIDILIFIIENRPLFAVFLLNPPIFEKTELILAFASIFG